ncbi:MAG: S41 family peptidase [Acidimicrobiia bacterium]
MRRFNTIRVAVILAALLASACTGTSGSGTTIPPTTTASPNTSAGSSSSSVATSASSIPSETTAAGHDFETASCGEISGDLLCESYELIRRHYVDPVSDQDLVQGALAGLTDIPVQSGSGLDVCPLPTEAFVSVCDSIDQQGLDEASAEKAAVMGMIESALDPNSAYFDADALAVIEEEQSGQIEGIGALVSTKEEGADQPNTCQVISDLCHLVIVATIEGGPARAAGLQADDVFVAVNGQPIQGKNIDEVTSMVRGPAGTDVELTFDREGKQFTVTIERAAIQIPVVSSEMVGSVAYLRLNLFTENADEQLRDELGNLLTNDPSALVFDLRDNPGGLLSTAVGVASEFIDHGLVVSTQSPDATTPYEVESGGLATDPGLPMYIVVNQGSASASEVVAGALSDAGRATIVGENTYGKNTVQQRFPLSNGGALKLTIARWLTPEGHDYGGTGITPDVSAQLPETMTPAEVVGQVVPTTAG